MSVYTSDEVRSGFLITASLVLMLGLTFIVGKFTGGSTQTWQVRFGYVNGLEKNAPVYFAGHEVGKVEKVQILKGKERPIVLSVRMTDRVQLAGDSEVYIDTLGLMGEKFVEFTPGTEVAGALAEGTILEGHDPIPTHQLIEKMNLLADRMDQMTLSLNPMIEKVNGMISGSEEEIAKIIANFHETSANIRDMTHELKLRPWRLVRKGN